EPLGQVLEKHTPYFQQTGVHPSQYIENAISWDQAFRNPTTREQAIQQFAQSYGLNITINPPDPNAPDITSQLPQLIQQQVQQAIAPIQSQFEQTRQEAT